MNPKHVSIPKRMQHLNVDRRGYPVPVMVKYDDTGRPHFTMNEETIRQQVIIEDRCSICGDRLEQRRWFIGGPLSAFHPKGTYIDPPVHEECKTYALKVCPYLAAPSYAKRVGEAMAEKSSLKDDLVYNATVMSERPEVFVAVEASFSINVWGLILKKLPAWTHVTPGKPYVCVQVWQHGQMLEEQW